MLVLDLDDDTRVLGKERTHDVAVGTDIVQVDMHAAFRIGEAHLEQRGDESASRYVVTSDNPSLLNHLLHSHKGIGEVLGILHRRHIVAHLTQALGKG